MAGWRLGWLVVPKDGIDAARARMGNLFLTPPSLAQHAGLVAMDCNEELEGQHRHLRPQPRAAAGGACRHMGLGKIAPPDGAFYIYADVSDFTDDSMEFCKALLEATGVATAPGIDFDPLEGRHFMRFSFAVSTPLVEEAIKRIEPVVCWAEQGQSLTESSPFGGRFCTLQISTWLPSSTTRLVGRRKNSIALAALRSIQANSFSRQIAMPGFDEASRVWRERKKLVCIISNVRAAHR